MDHIYLHRWSHLVPLSPKFVHFRRFPYSTHRRSDSHYSHYLTAEWTHLSSAGMISRLQSLRSLEEHQIGWTDALGSRRRVADLRNRKKPWLALRLSVDANARTSLRVAGDSHKPSESPTAHVSRPSYLHHSGLTTQFINFS